MWKSRVCFKDVPNTGNDLNGYIGWYIYTTEYHLPFKNYVLDVYALMGKALLSRGVKKKKSSCRELGIV